VQLLQRGKLKPDEQREAINIIDRNSRSRPSSSPTCWT